MTAMSGNGTLGSHRCPETGRWGRTKLVHIRGHGVRAPGSHQAPGLHQACSRSGAGHRGRTRHRGCTKLVHVRAPGFGHRGHTKLPLGAGLADRRRVDQRLADLRRRRRAVAVGPGRDAGVVRGAAASNIHTRPPPVTQHFNPGPQRSSPGSRASPASSAGPRSGSGEVSVPSVRQRHLHTRGPSRQVVELPPIRFWPRDRR